MVDLAFGTQACRVDNLVLLAVVLNHGVDCVTRRASDVAHDRTVNADKAVRKRAFARIRTADNGDVDDFLFLNFLMRGKLGELFDDFVEQIARAVAVRSRNGARVAQAQAIEFPQGLVFLIRVVELVHREQHGFTAFAQHASHFNVVGRGARTTVDEENHDVSLVRAGKRLFANGFLERVLVTHLDTAGIDEHEVHAIPIGLMIRAVARDAAHLVNDSLVLTGNAVDKRGLAHVGATHNSNNR